MANDYVFPFGVDGTKFFEGLNELDKGVDNLTANVKDATITMQKGFTDASAAGDKLGNTITVDAEKAAALRDQAKGLGKDLGDALSGKNVTGDVEKKLVKFTDLMGKFSTAAGKPVKFNIDSAKLEQFAAAIENGADELQVLAQVVELTKNELAQLDPNSAEFQQLNQQLQVATEFMEALGNASAGTGERTKSLKGQLREMKAALSEMEIAGKGNTQEFKALSIRAGELEDQIGDVSNRVKVLASDTKFLDAGVQAIQGVAGAFTAAQGAAALFGSENEEVQKTIQKVTGAMAILQGIQAIATALNKDSALSVLFFSKAQQGAAVSTVALAGAETAEAGATVAATAATNTFTAALLANPITLIVIALAAAVAALVAFTSSSDDAEEATTRLNAALESQETLLKLQESGIKRRTELRTADAKAQGAVAESQAKTDAQRARIAQATTDKVNDIQSKGLKESLKLQQSALSETRFILDNTNAIKELKSEDYKKLQDKELEQSEKVKDIQNQIRIEELNGQKDAADKSAALEKARIDQAKKDAEERKKILEQQIKFTAELEKARVEGIVNQYDKERAAARANANQQIQQLEAEKSLSAKAEKDKQALIVQLRGNLTKALADIDKKQAADTAALRFKANQLFADLSAEGAARDLEQLRLGFDEKRAAINEEFKNEKELRLQLLKALNASQIREEQKLTDEATNAALQKQEERAVLEIETATKFLPDLPGIEEQKQIEVLKVKIKYAQLQEQALLDQGNAENSTVVLQAKKQVQELQKALGIAIQDAAEKSSGVDFFKLLGLGELSDDQRAAVTDAAKQALDSITQITDFIIGQYQRQIDKKQEVIDQIDDSINDLEKQLEKEQSLRDEGFANNVDVIQAELDEKKKAKDEEIKQQQDLQNKQRDIAKAQLILDTAVQASNLITASTKIFNSLAAIPFVGIPLAITTIALMTGAFITAKIKAFQLVNDQKSFGGGGWIDGKPHSQGGKKYLAADGTGAVRELEEGEHVTKRSQAQKYAHLLEAINNDDLGGMNEDALRSMLQGMGIHLSADASKDVVNVARERDTLKQQVILMESPGMDIADDVKAINNSVSYLAQKERDRIERWEDDKYRYEKSGNKTSKIRK